MVCKPERYQKGFTLIEILIALSIIGILWGVGLSVMPRLLSDSGPGSLARRLAGAGQEARQMALLQHRPWELLIDLDHGFFTRAPLGAVHKRELRASDRDAQHGETREQDLVAQRREELGHQPMDTLRATRRYDSLAFTYDDKDSDLFVSAIPEEVKIIRIWKQGGYTATEGRVSLVFGPRGYIQPAVVWFEIADSPGKDRYTLYFSGIMPPEVVNGMLLPDNNGVLTPVELP